MRGRRGELRRQFEAETDAGRDGNGFRLDGHFPFDDGEVSERAWYVREWPEDRSGKGAQDRRHGASRDRRMGDLTPALHSTEANGVEWADRAVGLTRSPRYR